MAHGGLARFASRDDAAVPGSLLPQPILADLPTPSAGDALNLQIREIFIVSIPPQLGKHFGTVPR